MSQCNTATPRYYGDTYQLQNDLREKPPRDHDDGSLPRPLYSRQNEPRHGHFSLLVSSHLWTGIRMSFFRWRVHKNTLARTYFGVCCAR